MKKEYLKDTLLVLCCMLAPVTPSLYAKKLVVIFFIFIVSKILFSRDILYFINSKLLILIFFIPGMSLAIFYSGEAFFRFLPILLIIFGYPFSNYKINFSIPLIVSIFILFFLIFTQIFLAYGEPSFLSFRDSWYPFKYAEKFDAGYINSASELIIQNKRGMRFGGLYHNPNDLAGIVFFYYLIFDLIGRDYLKSNLKENHKFLKTLFFFITFFVIVSLMLTYSRTILFVFILYFFFTNLDFKLIIKKNIKLKINISSLILIFFAIFLLAVIYDSIITGVFNSRGSFNLKLNILLRYLNDATLLNLLIGGTNDRHFDMEWGYWLGNSGIFGIIAFIIFFRMMIKIIPNSKLLVFILILAGIGATIFYNFMMVSILTLVIIIKSSLYFKNSKAEIR